MMSFQFDGISHLIPVMSNEVRKPELRQRFISPESAAKHHKKKKKGEERFASKRRLKELEKILEEVKGELNDLKNYGPDGFYILRRKH